MDIVLSRPKPAFWDPEEAVGVTSSCSLVVDTVPSSLPPYAPERFVPLKASRITCEDQLDSPDRKFASLRKSLSAGWALLADACVVISLREASERRKHVVSEFSMVGLLPELTERCHWYIADRPARQNGVYGCYRSHMAVLNEAQRRGWKRVLVFEDDLFFLPQMSSGVLHNVADALDIDDTIRAIGMGTTFVMCESGGVHDVRNIFRARGSTSGTTCYVATPRLFQRNQDIIQRMADPTEPDEILSHPDFIEFDLHLYSDKVSDVYHVLPNPIVQLNLGTSIGYQGNLFATWSPKVVKALGLQDVAPDVSHPRVRKLMYATGIATLAAVSVLALTLLLLKRRRSQRSIV